MAGRNKFATLAAAMSPERQAAAAVRVAELREEMALAELRQISEQLKELSDRPTQRQ